ncbi:MAG: bile acid:sodium symporter [Pirellulales bacterium]
MEWQTIIRSGDQRASFVQRHFLWLLLACYALATVWPDPGLKMHDWRWPVALDGNGHVTFPLLLLAWMLFCAAVMTDLGQIRAVLRRPLVLCVAIVAVWAGPAMLVVVAGWIVPRLIDDPARGGLLVGLALVASMPVANSSVGWVQSAGGNLALGLALVVLSISLSPWVTPQLLAWLGMSLSPDARVQCERLVNHYSGWFFVIWVILPTALGFVCRGLITPRRAESAAGWFTLASAAALLLLNFISSSLALPTASRSQAALLVTAALLAIALSAVGLALGWLIGHGLRLPQEERSALSFGLSMKHTGLALVLTEAVLTDKKLAILLIVLATLAQHMLAGLVQWMQCRRASPPLAA